MELFEAIEKRFSCREFKDERIKRDELNKILEAGRLAPTACNNQPELIYVVESEPALEKLKNGSKYTFNSKTILVVCYNTCASWHRRYDSKDHGNIDAAIVAENMVLMATALGIGSCYVCAMKPDIIKEALDIPSEYEVVCMLPLGYPKEIKPHNTRKDLSDIIIYK